MHLLVWQQIAPKVYFLKGHWVFCLLILESELFSQKIFGMFFLAMSLTWATVYNTVAWGNIRQADRSYLHRHYIKDWHGDGLVHFETCVCDISTFVSVVWQFLYSDTFFISQTLCCCNAIILFHEKTSTVQV